MTKGKFGLSPAAVAVIAFGFCALRQPQSVLLVTGFALMAEKDDWLNRQAMQALLLTIAYYLTELVTGWIFGGLARLFGWMDLHGAAGAMGKADAFVGDFLYLALIALSVFAVLRVLRGRDAGLPFIAKMSGGDFAAAFVSNTEPAASPVQAAPVQVQYAPTTPPQPASAATVDVSEPELAVRRCAACSAPLQEGFSFCIECGAKVE